MEARLGLDNPVVYILVINNIFKITMMMTQWSEVQSDTDLFDEKLNNAIALVPTLNLSILKRYKPKFL